MMLAVKVICSVCFVYIALQVGLSVAYGKKLGNFFLGLGSKPDQFNSNFKLGSDFPTEESQPSMFQISEQMDASTFLRGIFFY